MHKEINENGQKVELTFFELPKGMSQYQLSGLVKDAIKNQKDLNGKLLNIDVPVK